MENAYKSNAYGSFASVYDTFMEQMTTGKDILMDRSVFQFIRQQLSLIRESVSRQDLIIPEKVILPDRSWKRPCLPWRGQ